MAARRMKKTIATSLSEEELAELDRLREQQSLARSQALRWYVDAMHRLPLPAEPEPDEVEALRDAEAEFARGGGRPRAVLHDLEPRRKQSR